MAGDSACAVKARAVSTVVGAADVKGALWVVPGFYIVSLGQFGMDQNVPEVGVALMSKYNSVII